MGNKLIITNNIRRLRFFANEMTQAELAKRADTKQSNISRFESGNYNPSVEFLQKIAGALDKRLEITLR